jgi:type IV pilus assembly protein PilA
MTDLCRNRSPKRTKGLERGFSLVELLIVVGIILIIAAIAIPNLLKTKIQANQAAAVSTLRNIHNSQAVYILQYGASSSYASSLSMLGPAPAGGQCNSLNACLVDDFIGCAAQPCPKSGYNYYVVSSVAAAPFTDYTGTATPVSFGNTGQNNYCTADDGIIRFELNPTASVGAVPRATCVNNTLYSGLRN